MIRGQVNIINIIIGIKILVPETQYKRKCNTLLCRSKHLKTVSWYVQRTVALPSRLLRSTTGLISGSGRTPDPPGLSPTWRRSTLHRSGADRNEPQNEDSLNLPGRKL